MYAKAHSRIVSTGVSIPENRISSEDIMNEIDSRNRFGIGPDWLRRTTGIVERRESGDGVVPSDLAADAAREALDRAGVSAREVGMLIYAGVIRDHLVEPGTAHIVQHKIGATCSAGVDLNNACLGFMSAIHIMDALIATGQIKYGLVVTGEQGCRLMRRAMEELKNMNDRAEVHDLVAGLTLGDAGAAMLLGPKRERDLGLVGFQMESNGEHSELCYCGDVVDTGLLHTDMSGILSAAGALTAATFKELLEDRLHWSRTDLSRFVAHQVGKGSFKIYTEVLCVAKEIMTETVWELGNIITATIPVNLHRLMYSEPLDEGDKVILAGAGSGVCAGRAGLVWERRAAGGNLSGWPWGAAMRPRGRAVRPASPT
ncbi:MAG: 3-oxoacyl-ACP synthase III family protein, partial [Gammaproteobacteria bacterium]